LNTTRAKIFFAAGALLALALCAGGLYAAGLPPFREGDGKVKAADVCPELGPSSEAAAALDKVLPDESTYAFSHDVSPRLDTTDSSYDSSCFVSGSGDQLLVAKATLIQNESAEDWTAWVKGTASGSDSAQAAKPFPFGAAAVASSQFAAASIPCTSAGKIPGGQYNISLSVELKKRGKVDDATTRTQLMGLVKNSASYAVATAKCDLSRNLAGNKE
jgi:hypothetical protein